MQIATLSYRYKPKENGHDEHRARLCRRQILTTITTNPTKKIKSRRSLHSSDITTQSFNNGQLPLINHNSQRRSSIRIQGSSLPSSKLGESSAYSFNHQQPRSRSRQSNLSDHLDGRSRSVCDRENKNNNERMSLCFFSCLGHSGWNDATNIEISSDEIWLSGEITYTGFLWS